MYEYRQLLNYKQGTLSLPIGTADLTMKSTGFTGLPADLSTTKYIPVCLGDPSSQAFEVVWATAHSAGADTLTIVRAREGTASNQQWSSGSAWYVGTTERDLIATVATRSALPTDAHIGMRCWITDEGAEVERTLSQGWMQQAGANPANFITAGGAVAAGKVIDLRWRRVTVTTNSTGYFTANVPNGPYPSTAITAWAQLGSGGAGVSVVLDQLDATSATFRVNRQSGAWASSDAIIGHVFFLGC